MSTPGHRGGRALQTKARDEALGTVGGMAEREWNDKTRTWEVDGNPLTYRVSWKTGHGEQHSRDFASIDDGYEYYQWLKKSPRLMENGLYAVDIQWDLIYP